MKVAVVHDWLTVYAGSERVLEQILAAFSGADLYTVIDFLSQRERGFIQNRPVHTSFIQRLPGSRRTYRAYLPLMPLAVEQFDLRGYDVVISSSHAVAKGVITGPDTLHVSYIHSPPRYAWDLQGQYLEEAGLTRGIKGMVARGLLHYLRLWDGLAGQRPDILLANSHYIARRIQKTYRREVQVIYPPVDTDAFTLERNKDNFYLAASRMVPYKRMDLIVEAFAQMPHRKLVVIGDGPDMPKVRAKAGPNITLLGYQPFEVLRDHMRRARAFVFAAEEDFGIAPVEAQACGTPVIAFGRGGATETVVPGETGVFFQEQSVKSLIEAVERFERLSFDPLRVRQNAERFSAERFRREFAALVEREWDRFKTRLG
jgi:glycosyltransferase involved in cell wall biosynthesis